MISNGRNENYSISIESSKNTLLSGFGFQLKALSNLQKYQGFEMKVKAVRIRDMLRLEK